MRGNTVIDDYSQQHDLISANFDVCRHKQIGSKIASIQKEGPTQLKKSTYTWKFSYLIY